ncbi:MAG: TIGR00266 family protein [Clostridium sp.]
MNYEIICEGLSKVLRLKVLKGETCIVEGGGMISMDSVFSMEAKSLGTKSTIKRLATGESACIQYYKAKQDGEILVAPSYLGDIKVIELDGSKRFRLGKSAFLASSDGIQVEYSSIKMKDFVGGEGIVQSEAHGIGNLFVSAYGTIFKKELVENQEYIIDTNHLVLWDSEMKYKLETVGKGLSSVFGGEGIVYRFYGPGEILIQSRNPENNARG